MFQLKPPFRPAAKDDAALLAELVNYAGEGLPLYLWEQMRKDGETAWDVGRARASREEGAFSYRNAIVIEHNGKAVGCLIGYEISDDPEPIGPDMPAMFRPLQKLENLAPGTWYVNVLAVVPETRGMGLGGQMLGVAEEIGRDLNKRGMSVIVAGNNEGAKRLYLRCGYAPAAERAMVKDGWQSEGDHWALLIKAF